jgi:hypothetical protein
LEGGAAVFAVDGAVVAEEQIAADEGAAAFLALKGAFLCVWES